MTSEVYSRKWRPSTFSDLVGQEHISTVLKNALLQNRLAHSYLFCGPRGTGKTSTARILGKSANCVSINDGEPCNSCNLCSSANQGRFLDIVELDAASNRGIDEIRDIRDKVNFSPVEGRYKVYIIDEAHMLTDQASNAFLKTLEEPPPHVIFILCTTEAHKILPTIISRCQRHDFRRINNEIIIRQLNNIAVKESVTVDTEALNLISRHSSGSLRDAENLLEQVVVSYGNNISVAQVLEILGLADNDVYLQITTSLLSKQATECLTLVNKASWEGIDIKRIHLETLEILRAAMLIEWGVTDNIDLPGHVIEELTKLIQKTSPRDLTYALKVWGSIDTRQDSQSTLPLELAIIDISNNTFSNTDSITVSKADPQLSIPNPNRQPPAKNPITDSNIQSQHKKTEPDSDYQLETVSEPQEVETTLSTTSLAPEVHENSDVTNSKEQYESNDEIRDNWAEALKILSRCKGIKYTLGALLRDCDASALETDTDVMILPFRNQANLDRMIEEMDDPNSRKMVYDAIEKSFGKSFSIEPMLSDQPSNQSPDRTIQQSPLVRAALGMGARIVEENIE